MSIIFADKQHESLYDSFCDRMSYLDGYHKCVAYLLALDNSLRDHASAVFDFENDVIKPEGLNAAFQTSTSMKSTRLLFNLWNGYCSDGSTYTNDAGYTEDLPSSYYTPDSIFGCSYMPFYLQAVRLRFEAFDDED